MMNSWLVQWFCLRFWEEGLCISAFSGDNEPIFIIRGWLTVLRKLRSVDLRELMVSFSETPKA